MALPISRDTTYVPGAQVKSADLNDIQDQIIASYAKLLTYRKTVIPAVAAREASGTTDWSITAARARATVAAPGLLFIPIPHDDGITIDLVKVMVQQSVATASAMHAALWYVTTDGVAHLINSVLSAGVATLQDLVINVTADFAADQALLLQVDSNSGTGGAMNRDVFYAEMRWKRT